MKIVLYLGIGLVVGTISRALGIGGGVLLVPALVWLCGMEPPDAAGTTLAVLVVPVVLPAVLYYAYLGKLNVEAACWLAGAFAVGSFLGAYLVSNRFLPDRELKLFFGLLMIYIAIRFILGSDQDVLTAFLGLSATLFAWVGYLLLRSLGRRHLPPPPLGDQIRRMREQGRGETDYSI